MLRAEVTRTLDRSARDHAKLEIEEHVTKRLIVL